MGTDHLADELLNEQLEADLKKVAQLSTGTIEATAERFVDQRLVHGENPWSTAPREEYVAFLLGAVDREMAAPLERFVQFVSGRAASPKLSQTPVELVNDLRSSFKSISDEEWGVLSEAVLRVFEVVEKRDLRSEFIRLGTEEFGPAGLAGMGTCVDARVIPDRVFLFGDTVDSFSPEVRQFSVRGTVTFLLDRAEQDRISFQVSSQELDMVIDNLVALRKTMQTAKRRLLG